MGEGGDNICHLGGDLVEIGIFADVQLVHIERAVDLYLYRMNTVARLAVMAGRKSAGKRLVAGDRAAAAADGTLNRVRNVGGAAGGETVADDEIGTAAPRIGIQRTADRRH